MEMDCLVEKEDKMDMDCVWWSPDIKGQRLELGSEDGIDECIRTITCEGNFSGNLFMQSLCTRGEPW